MLWQPDLLADVELLTTAAGGRRAPIGVEQYNCPFGFAGEYFECRIDLSDHGTLAPGARARLPVKFLRPDLILDRLAPGAAFVLWEGRDIGKGTVVQVFLQAPPDRVAALVEKGSSRPPMSKAVTVDLMKGFLDAFNRHDLDAIMDHFADECVFYMPRGAGPRGDRYSGKQEVRAGLARRFEGIPNVHYGEDRHWACGDFGVSEWTLTGTSVSGQRVEVRGVDRLEFVDGKITRKDAFWKIVE